MPTTTTQPITTDTLRAATEPPAREYRAAVVHGFHSPRSRG
jgi:hypothetical protein